MASDTVYYLALEYSESIHECRFLRKVWGKRHERSHLIAAINPPISIPRQQRSVDEVIISVRTEGDVDSLEPGQVLWVDCAYSLTPVWNNTIDEEECEKYSPGSLHTSYEEAKRESS